QPLAGRLGKHPERQPRAPLEQRREQLAQPGQAARVADAEDDPQDHLEGDRRHPGPQLERLAQGPGLDLGGGDGGDLAREALHRGAVERGGEEAALAQPSLAVEAEQRVLSHERGEEVPPDRPRAADVAVGLEDAARELGRGDVHEPRRGDEPDPEDRAEAAPAALEEGGRIAEVERRLGGAGQARRGRQRKRDACGIGDGHSGLAALLAFYTIVLYDRISSWRRRQPTCPRPGAGPAPMAGTASVCSRRPCGASGRRATPERPRATSWPPRARTSPRSATTSAARSGCSTRRSPKAS